MIDGYSVDDLVQDIWYPEMGYGKITEVLKTVIHVKFSNKFMVYDESHLQFLTNITKDNNNVFTNPSTRQNRRT